MIMTTTMMMIMMIMMMMLLLMMMMVMMVMVMAILAVVKVSPPGPCSFLEVDLGQMEATPWKVLYIHPPTPFPPCHHPLHHCHPDCLHRHHCHPHHQLTNRCLYKRHLGNLHLLEHLDCKMLEKTTSNLWSSVFMIKSWSGCNILTPFLFDKVLCKTAVVFKH